MGSHMEFIISQRGLDQPDAFQRPEINKHGEKISITMAAIL